MKSLTSFVLGFLIPIGIAAAKDITAEQKLKAELFQTRASLVQCQSKLNNYTILQERQQLINEFDKTCEGKFDWGTMKCVAKEE